MVWKGILFNGGDVPIISPGIVPGGYDRDISPVKKYPLPSHFYCYSHFY